MSSSASPLRLFVPGDLATGLNIELPSDQAHYVAHVMRRSVGDSVLLFNGRDGEWRGDLVAIHKKAASIAVAAQTQNQPIERNLTLLFAPIKRTATDMIVQKASELGVTVLQPVITARTNNDRIRVDRLTAIAIEAAALAALTCWQALCGDWRHADKG